MSISNYIVAVSGGVDSVVLLDMLVNNKLPELAIKKEQIIVAHFDHGIRPDSAKDSEFVRGVAEKYGLSFELGQANLGINASEEEARNARYNFLRSLRKKYNGSIVIAHHQDDLIETMVLNLVRGTNWRGLISLRSNYDILRPLLNLSKNQLLNYAKENNLTWREDSTNQDQKYLRNYIRRSLIPTAVLKDPEFNNKLLKIQKNILSLEKQIATELQNLNLVKNGQQYKVSRYNLIMWPEIVALEVIYYLLTNLDSNWHPTNRSIKQVLNFSKTAWPGKHLEVSGALKILSFKTTLQFQKY